MGERERGEVTQYITMATNYYYYCTVVPLMRDTKSHLKKQSLKRGLPYLVGNQELNPLVSLPDYPPNTV